MTRVRRAARPVTGDMAHSRQDPPVIFLSGRLVDLRPVELDDLPRMQRWINDPDTRRGLLNVRAWSAHAERRFIEGMADRPDDLTLAIVARRGRRHVGVIGLHPINWTDRHATYGILIGEPVQRRRGFASDATRLILEHAFNTLNLHRVQLEVHEFNAGAIACYEKLGFAREGVARSKVFRDGRYWDSLQYAMLADEFRAGLSRPTARRPRRRA